MNQEDAFLQAIRERPLDDVTRLVYADELEQERDHLRARYLRVEIELSHLTEDVPCYDTLETELRELRAGIERKWLEQTSKPYDLAMHSYLPTHKISIIKVIRALTTHGLKEAKDLSEKVPPIIVQDGIARHRAEYGRDELRSDGAEVEVCVSGTAPVRPTLPLARRSPAIFEFRLGVYSPEQKRTVIEVIQRLLGCGLKEAEDFAAAELPVTLLRRATREQADEAWRAFARVAPVYTRRLYGDWVRSSPA